jgi:hypothetical protein
MPVIPQPSVDLASFLHDAGAGDVVLWSGTSTMSTAVETVSNSIYSHASMVIVDPSTGEKCLYQSVGEELGPDPLVNGTTHSGVQAGDLAATMTIVYNFQDYPTWCPLVYANKGDASWVQAVWSLAQTLDGTPFPGAPKFNPVTVMYDLAKLLFEGRELGNEITTPLFCSGLVGLMLKRLGVIDATVPCNAYFPKDFSSLYPGFLHTLNGFSFGEDTIVTMPGQ